MEAKLTPRRRRLEFAGSRFTFVRSVWWDATEPEIFHAEIGPYFDVLDARLRPSVILDAGAADGHFAVAAARRFPEARIVCFEPSLRQRIILRRNAQLNGVADRVRIRADGLWCDAGQAKFRTHGAISSLEAVSMLPKHLPFEESIQTITLDAWCDRAAPAAMDLLKMDIEGAELEALEGARRCLAKFRPELLVQAYHIREGSRTYERCARFLEPMGYECREVPPASGLLHARPHPAR